MSKKQFLDFNIKKSDGGKLTIVASDETLDRMGEVVPLDSWDLKNYLKNPVLLVDHDYKVEKIVGKAEGLEVGEKQFTFSPDFHSITQLAKEVDQMVNSAYAPAVSVGFMTHAPKKDGDRPRNELLEISFVAVGANPNALSLSAKSVTDPQKEKVQEWAEQKGIETTPPTPSGDPPATDEPVVEKIDKNADIDKLANIVAELAEMKEGRVLSGKNRTKIVECSTALKQAAALLDDLLVATESNKGKDGDEHKGRTPVVVQRVIAPNKAKSPIARALQDVNRISRDMLTEINAEVQS